MEADQLSASSGAARAAGILYLIVVVLGIVTLKLRSGLLVFGDPAASLAHIAAATGTYRLSIVTEFLSSLVYLAVVALLYAVLRGGGASLSRVALLIGGAGCVIGAVATLLLTTPLTAADPATAGGMLLLYGQVYRGAILFFGCYCALLGVLAWRSKAVPRAVAVLLGLASTAWLISGFGTFLAPDAIRPFALMLIGLGGLGETALALWLTLFGARRA